MKYFIAFASLTAVVSAVLGPNVIVNPKCNKDNCLRSIIASNVVTRDGFADCTSFLLTTVTPAPSTFLVTETTTDTITATSASTEVVTVSFVAAAEARRRRAFEDLHKIGGFKKIVRRQDEPEPEPVPEPVPGTAVTVTNTMPSYLTKSCTQIGETLPTDRLSSACSCIGATEVATTAVERPTVTSTTRVPHPSNTVTIIPTITLSATTFKLQFGPSPSAFSGQYLATAVESTTTHLVPTASAAAAAVVLKAPDGAITIGGKIILANKSNTGTTVETRFLRLLPVGFTPTGDIFATTCTLNDAGNFACLSPAVYSAFVLADAPAVQKTLRLWNPASTLPGGQIKDITLQAVNA